MIDFKAYLAHAAEWTPLLEKRAVSKLTLGTLKREYAALQELNKKREELYVARNRAAQGKDRPTGGQPQADRERGTAVKVELTKIQQTLLAAQERFEQALRAIPNLPAPDVPEGEDETCNAEVRTVGERPNFAFPPKDHLALGKALDLIDTETAAKVSGSRFSYLKNEAVLIEFALVRFVLDMLQKEGFQPIIPPVIIKQEIARKTGYPESVSDEDAYALKKDNLFLVGTSEQSIVPYYADTVLKEAELPKRFVGFSTCFRREAGSYGKDVRGIIRQHQFDKVEMVSFTHPDKSAQEHEFLLSMGERLTQLLELPYRVMKMCIGELAPPQSKKYDIECWLPSQKRYRETHSASNCTDYQANNFNIRYRAADGKNAAVHTLNGTALAIGRTLVALLENHQRPDGSIAIPKALAAYTGFDTIKPR